jgi:SAM-dependent methyltransferase
VSPSDAVQKLIDNYAKTGNTLTILEAGCGSLSHINIPSNAHVVGVDISQQQLDRNNIVSEKILADLQNCRLPEGSFDMIICWDVLEHLDTPSKALEVFFKSCKENGLIILAFPNLYSLKGLITKITPHIAHIWFYRYILGSKQAGKNDAAPFPTPFRLAMTHSAIRKFATSHNGAIEFFVLYEGGMIDFLREKFRIFNFVFDAVSVVSRVLSFRTIDAMSSDCIIVLRKQR